MERKIWTRDELVVAFNLYCKTPFGRIHNKNLEIIQLANLIGRTPSALSWKLANFARLDPTLAARGIKGASHGSKAEKEIWNEFNGSWSELSFESEKRLAHLRGETIATSSKESDSAFPEGDEKDAITKTRVNQHFFRQMILASYNSRCCLTGLRIPEMLIASHIVPWAVDTKNRINPRNGLCLNAFHDRAFDRGLITLSNDFKVKVSPSVKELQDDEVTSDLLFKYENRKIELPDKFIPDVCFLDFHNREIFR